MIANEEVFRLLNNEYFETIDEYKDKLGQNYDLILEEEFLAHSFNEIKKDIDILEYRRNPKNGISKSKIAGIISYRLNKHNSVTLCSNKISDKTVRLFPIYINLIFIFKYILWEKDCQLNSLNELAYILSDRHINQENLGLLFEHWINK